MSGINQEQIASMGPSMSIDGVYLDDQRSRMCHSCFNGAVDEHRRSPGEGPASKCSVLKRFNGAVDEHRRSPVSHRGNDCLA